MKLVTLVLCLAIIIIPSEAKNTGKSIRTPIIVSTIYRTKEYKLFNTTKTWHEARIACAKDDGKLAVIENPLDYEEMLKVIRNANTDWINIGFYMVFEDALTIDGKPLEYRKWAPNEPSKSFKFKPYGCMNKNALLGDTYGNFLRNYVCEYDVPRNTVEKVVYSSYPYVMTWPQARRYCQIQGGHLPLLTDKKQYSDLLEFLKQKKITERFWIGYHNMFKTKQIISLETGQPTDSKILRWPVNPDEPGYISLSGTGETHFENEHVELYVICAIHKKPCK